MAIRRNKLDIVFSNLIRERANWYCEVCCTNFRYGGGMLDCAHIMGRRSVATRWHPLNAVSMCRSDHLFFTEHPFDFADWCRGHFGGDVVSELQRVANTPVKWTKKDREEIYQHYKRELKRLEEKRANGYMLKIDIVPHPLMYDFKVAA